jgi:hypothetical protein
MDEIGLVLDNTDPGQAARHAAGYYCSRISKAPTKATSHKSISNAP